MPCSLLGGSRQVALCPVGTVEASLSKHPQAEPPPFLQTDAAKDPPAQAAGKAGAAGLASGAEPAPHKQQSCGFAPRAAGGGCRCVVWPQSHARPWAQSAREGLFKQGIQARVKMAGELTTRKQGFFP